MNSSSISECSLPEVLKPKNLQDYTGISKSHYIKMRKAGLGPREMRIDGAVRIRREDALEWIAELKNPESEHFKRSVASLKRRSDIGVRAMRAKSEAAR